MDNDREIRETRHSKLASSYEAYATRWEVSSSSLANQGAYRWMVRSIEGYIRVLEIGTGTGMATLELLNNGHSVVSVDENPKCLQISQQRLADAGYNPELVLRGSRNFSAPHYQIQYRPISPPPQTQSPSATLIEGDLCEDPKLLIWLKSLQKFDAVACWLIGTHPERRNNQIYDRHNQRTQQVINSDKLYRLWVQNRVYELADEILRPGGKLSIVDRGKTLEEERDRLNLHEAHREQASVTHLAVPRPNAITEFTYREPRGGVPLVSSSEDLIDTISLHCIVSERS